MLVEIVSNIFTVKGAFSLLIGLSVLHCGNAHSPHAGQVAKWPEA